MHILARVVVVVVVVVAIIVANVRVVLRLSLKSTSPWSHEGAGALLTLLGPQSRFWGTNHLQFE